MLATFSGIVVTVGFVWQGVLVKSSIRKMLYYYLAAVCITFPLLVLYISEYQGVVQRARYAQVLLWFWFFFQRKS